MVDLGPIFNVDAIAGDTLTLRQLAAPTIGTFNAADFGEGDVVCAPVIAPPAVQSAVYPFARMIAPSIERQIDNGNQPLTPWPREAGELFQEWLDAGGLQLPFNVTFGTFRVTWSHRLDSRIVGLYEGGGGYVKDSFHPTGACKMRKGRNAYWSFCPVCRYILAEMIDPSVHGAIDAEYAEHYPSEP
jgi:hypothetical protein